MKYLKRLLFVLYAFTITPILALIITVLFVCFDVPACVIYYIATGKSYTHTFSPLGIAISEWMIGIGFKWKYKYE